MPTCIVLDKTAEMMLLLLQEKLTEQPEAPDPDRDDAYTTQMRARRYDEWERQIGATRLMLSARLVNLALDQLPEEPGEPKT